MSTRQVQFVRTVDAPYPVVNERLRAAPAGLFGTETADDGRTIARLVATLRDRPIERDMLIEIVAFDQATGAAPESHLVLRGDASHHAELFPHLEARIDAMPMADGRTAVFFVGTYTPPLGPVGTAFDTAALHRFAEESLLGLFYEAADRLAGDA